MCIFRHEDRAYYRFFHCGENEIWWCYDIEHAHKFRTKEAAEYVIRTFKIAGVEVVDLTKIGINK